MMKELTKQEAIELHVKSDMIIQNAICIGDYKTNNKEFRKRKKLVDFLGTRTDLAKEVFSELLENECLETQMSSAAECLKQGIFIEKAEKILKEISARTDIGILSFSAEMILRVWRGEYPGHKL